MRTAFQVQAHILYPRNGSIVVTNEPLHIVVLSHDFELARDDNKIFLAVDSSPLRAVQAGLFMEVRSTCILVAPLFGRAVHGCTRTSSGR